jgi:uncharacterized protein (TIGR00106 family)
LEFEEMAIVEVSIVPVGTKTPSLSQHIARVLQVLEGEEGIKYELTSMGTIMEGDLGEILSLVKKIHEVAFNEEVLRVVTIVKIDDRRDKSLTMEGKVKAVKEKLSSVTLR